MNLHPTKEPARTAGKGFPDAAVAVSFEAPPRMARLILYPPDAGAVEITLNQEVVTLGRDPGNRIVISSSYISSFHARFQRLREADSFELTDLGSNNGTRVNGHKVEKKVLGHGDMIQFGPALIARFEIDPASGGSREAVPSSHGKLEERDPGAHALNPQGALPAGGENGSHSQSVSMETASSQLAGQRAELEQLKLEARKRRNDLRAGEAQLKEVRAERDTLLVAVAQVTDEHARAKAAALAQDGAVRSARETLAELEGSIQQLQKTRDEEMVALAELKAAGVIETARVQEESVSAKAALEIRSGECRREVQALDAGIQQRREEQASLARSIANRREELDELKAALAALPAEQETLHALQAEQTRVRHTIGCHRDELQAVETGLERSRREEAQLGQQLVQKRAELSELEETLRAQRDNGPALQAAVEGLGGRLAAGKAETAALEASAKDLAAAIESRRVILSGMDHQCEHLQGEIAAGESRLNALHREVQAAEALLENQRRERRETEATVAGLKLEGAALQGAIHSAVTGKEEALAAVNALRADSLTQKALLDLTQLQLNEAGKQLQASVEQRHLLEDSVIRARSELTALKAESAHLAEQQAALRGVSDRKSALEAEIRRLESKAEELKAANAAMDRMAGGLADCRQQIASAEARLQQLDALIRDTEAAAASRQRERESERAAHETRLREWEVRLMEQERQVTAERTKGPPAARLPVAPPAGRAADSLFHGQEPEAPPHTAFAEESLSLEEELIRMGFEVQPLKKHQNS